MDCLYDGPADPCIILARPAYRQPIFAIAMSWFLYEYIEADSPFPHSVNQFIDHYSCINFIVIRSFDLASIQRQMHCSFYCTSVAVVTEISIVTFEMCKIRSLDLTLKSIFGASAREMAVSVA